MASTLKPQFNESKARVGDSHSYGTMAVRRGLVVSTGDHRMVGYRIPTERGDPDGGAEGDCVGGGLQAELEG
jgi:hypothetical protein